MSIRGQFYVRLEHDQWEFARERRAAYDGAIVAARYLAPYPVGHPSEGQPADRLAQAVVTAGRALVVDPDTPALCSGGAPRYSSAARLRATGAASQVRLPLTVDQVRDVAARDAFVDASMHDQRLASVVAAPHLEFRSPSDERLTMNLQMLRRVVRSAATQMPIAFVQVTRERLLRGVVAKVAAQYASTGVERVYLRVRGVGEDASGLELDAYLTTIEAFAASGMDVVADAVGRLGPVLIGGGALGFSSGGGACFRRVAKPLLAAGGGGGGEKVGVELAGRWTEVPREEAARAACPEGGCRVGRPDATIDDVREHRLHTLSRLAREAVDSDPAAMIRSLRASGLRQAREWAEVLERRERRAA
ncbi:MAG: hypothetical protein M3401_06710 [Actinomycetota bacterium]|nr:hypothetical protein [Actinomycetota bacterium]